jgi:2-iminobutanoate/2-iminopropanoate deaminase
MPQQQPSLERHHVVLPEHPENLPFSDAVTVGDMVYVAGRIGLDPATGYAPRELDLEIRYLLDGLRRVLEEAGALMEDLVTVTVFCTDLGLFGRFNEIYKTYFSGGFPARAFIGAARLLRAAHFEIQAIAIRGSAAGGERHAA